MGAQCDRKELFIKIEPQRTIRIKWGHDTQLKGRIRTLSVVLPKIDHFDGCAGL